MASDAAADLISLIIIVAALAALATSFSYSIPYAVRRYAYYRDGDGARKSYAKFRLFSILLPTAVVLCFFAVGLGAIALEDGAGRIVFLRLTILAAILLVAAQLIVIPIWDRRVMAMAEDEAEDSGQRDVVKKLDAAERESEDRYSETEQEKTEVRKRLDAQEEKVSEKLDAQEEKVVQRLDAQNESVKEKLDELLDILRRGRS